MNINKARIFFLSLLLLSKFCEALSQELGRPFIRNYSAKEYNAGSTMYDLVQDYRGVFFFANSWNLREYDGVTWNDTHLSNQRSAYAVELDDNGTVFVGGENEFGFLKPNEFGKMAYESLRSKIDPEIQDLGSVLGCYNTANGMAFVARNYVIVWDGTKAKLWTFNEGIRGSFYTDKLYVNRVGIGLQALSNDGFELVNGGEYFKDKAISAGLEDKDGNLLIATNNQGLFINKGNGVEQFSTSLDTYFKKNTITCAIKMSSGAYAFGTYTGGVAIIDANFELMCFVDRSSGLQDNGVWNLYEDKDQILWLALRNGTSRVEISTPINSWGESSGLQGYVRTIQRYKGTLYVGTTKGIYYLVNQGKGHSEFLKIDGLESDIRSSYIYQTPSGNKQLLMMGDGEFLQVKHGIKPKVERLFPSLPQQGSMMRPANEPSNRIYALDFSDEIRVYHFKNGKWVNDGLLHGVDDLKMDVFKVDHQGKVWTIEFGGKVTRFDVTYDGNGYWASNKESFGLDSGLPDDKFTSFTLLKNDFFLTSEKGIYHFNEDTKKFNIASDYGSQLADYYTGFYFFEEDVKGNLWYYAYQMGDDIWHEVAYKKPDGTYDIDSVSLRRLPVTDTWEEATYAEKDGGAVWFGGTWGLYKYDDSQNWSAPTKFQALIRKVTTGEDSLIFHGAFANNDIGGNPVGLSQDLSQELTVPFSANSLIFHFASNSFFDENANEYSYMLEGSSYEMWSNWERETKEHIQNLREGNYVFRVKARNIYGIVSDEASFTFTILPPWYRTNFAYAVYAIAVVALIWMIVFLNTVRLRKQKLRLEIIVEERTEEIRQQADTLAQQQEELVTKSEEIFEQNEMLENTNRKITDSINYASRIQKAILGEEEHIAANFKDAFVLFQPKDIVSGDFYWFTDCKNPISKQRKKLLIAADCTGHGVPGAFMTVMGASLLNEIVNNNEVLEPHRILHELDEKVIAATQRQYMNGSAQNGKVHDGMDMQVLMIDTWNAKLQFSGAKNPLYRIRNGEIEAFKGSKFPIGSTQFKSAKKFELEEIDMLPGDKFYLASDGYQDQFGGPEGRKFLRKRFRNLLLEISNLPMKEQKEMLYKSFTNWKGRNKQTDDILVIGFEV